MTGLFPRHSYRSGREQPSGERLFLAVFDRVALRRFAACWIKPINNWHTRVRSSGTQNPEAGPQQDSDSSGMQASSFRQVLRSAL